MPASSPAHRCDVWHPVHTHCPTTATSLKTARGVGVNASDVLRLMDDATYTLCPAGDAPDSPRVYSALAHGSIPLIDAATSLPPMAPWGEFSARIEFDAAGALVLPSAAREASMRRLAWAHRHAFECEPHNLIFAAYMERSLATLVEAARAQRAARQG